MPWVPVREIILQGSQRNLGQTALARGGFIESEPLGAPESPREEEGCVCRRCYLCEGFRKDPGSWLLMLNSGWQEQLTRTQAKKAFVIQYILFAVYVNK